MRYSYVTPAATIVTYERPAHVVKPTTRVIVRADNKTGDIGPDSPLVPRDAKRLHGYVERARSRRARLTYSLAITSEGRPLETVMLRVYDMAGSPTGYIGWVAGHVTRGCIMETRLRNHIGLDEFACWIERRPYIPPPRAEVGACPRCMIDTVRVKKNGQPYKHRDPDTGLDCPEGTPNA